MWCRNIFLLLCDIENWMSCAFSNSYHYSSCLTISPQKWNILLLNLFLVEFSWLSCKNHLLCDQCDVEIYFYYFLTWKTELVLSFSNSFHYLGRQIVPQKREKKSLLFCWHEYSWLYHKYDFLCDQSEVETYFKFFLTLKTDTDWSRPISILGSKDIALKKWI